jgi:hypothetical protein
VALKSIFAHLRASGCFRSSSLKIKTVPLNVSGELIFLISRPGAERETDMGNIKYPWDAALFALIGLLGLVLAGFLIAGRIGFGHFFAGLCLLGILAMLWVKRRVPQLWNTRDINIHGTAAQTQQHLDMVIKVLFGLLALSLILEYVL